MSTEAALKFYSHGYKISMLHECRLYIAAGFVTLTICYQAMYATIKLNCAFNNEFCHVMQRFCVQFSNRMGVMNALHRIKA